MPVYEYQCRACEHEFEREQRISDKPIKKCPSCGAMQAKRLISRTSFVLKGGGWYNDLYSSSKADKGKGDGGGDSGGDGSGGSAGKDSTSKPKKKSDAKPAGGSSSGGGKSGDKGKGSKAAA